MEGPIEYSIDEIGNIQLDTDKTSIIKGWADNPPNAVIGVYVPKKKKKKKICSFCKKLKQVYCIEGVQLMEISKVLQNKTIYHRTYHILCKSCASAKVI